MILTIDDLFTISGPLPLFLSPDHCNSVPSYLLTLLFVRIMDDVSTDPVHSQLGNQYDKSSLSWIKVCCKCPTSRDDFHLLSFFFFFHLFSFLSLSFFSLFFSFFFSFLSFLFFLSLFFLSYFSFSSLSSPPLFLFFLLHLRLVVFRKRRNSLFLPLTILGSKSLLTVQTCWWSKTTNNPTIMCYLATWHCLCPKQSDKLSILIPTHSC